MIYNSIDNIPAKLFFHIQRTGEVNLLMSENEKKSESELIEIFIKIEEQNSKYQKGENRIINISSEIEELICRFEKTELAVECLFMKINLGGDSEMEELLIEQGYKLEKDTYEKDLQRILRENKGLQNQVQSMQFQLESTMPESENDEKDEFEEVVISYGSIIGAGFIKTSEITLRDYYALINVGNNKMKSLKNNGKER